ncbi:4'-phosphopantetheinyl transferase family protein [Lysinibacillus sp. NPDC093190]|uniref:4'-phosphopantetheinyl transferase family protein n=1 Tax=Lysinibacillus sp. NPDC093190 TaxID=3390575 RepID=UPI003CFC6DC7
MQLINVYLYRTNNTSNTYSDFFKRYILFKETGLTGIQFEYSPYGKPYVNIPGYKNLHFNVSHTGHYIVGTVSLGCFIGIDIECIKPIEFDCIEYFMSETETAQFNRLNLKEDKLDYFYSIWTLKEAYSKMIGMGLNMNLTEVSFSLENQQFRSALGDVFCHSMIVDEHYRLSLISSKKVNINVVDIESNLVIEEFNI